MESGSLEKKLNELWLQRRDLVIAVGLFVGAGLLLFFGAYRFWQLTSELQITVELKEKELQEVEQRATILNTITPDDREGYELVEQALPRYKEPLKVMQTLEAISSNSRVALGEYDLNPGIVSTESADTTRSSRNRSSTRGTEALRLEIELSGSFLELTEAIQNIEESMPVMEITDLRIAPARRGGAGTDLSSVQYTATIQLESYYANLDPKQVAKGGAQQITPGQRRARDELQEMEYWLSETSVGEGGVANPEGNTDLFDLTP